MPTDRDEGSDEEVTEIEPTSTEGSKPPQSVEASEGPSPLEKERDDYKDKYLRACAELENFRRRVTKEKQELLKFSNERLLRSILQIKDDLDRASLHQETAELETLREGLSLIARDLEKILKQFHVRPLEVIGKPFDPNFHEAIAEEESKEHPPGTVMHQYQPGYLYHDRLLRPARVVVAKKPSAKS